MTTKRREYRIVFKGVLMWSWPLPSVLRMKNDSMAADYVQAGAEATLGTCALSIAQTVHRQWLVDVTVLHIIVANLLRMKYWNCMTEIWLYVFLQAEMWLVWYSVYKMQSNFTVLLALMCVRVVDPTSRSAVWTGIYVTSVDEQIRIKSVICVVGSIIDQIHFKNIFRIAWQNSEREVGAERVFCIGKLLCRRSVGDGSCN